MNCRSKFRLPHFSGPDGTTYMRFGKILILENSISQSSEFGLKVYIYPGLIWLSFAQEIQ